MKSLGEYLQSERMARGVTLEEISTESRISIKMLQAIEEGNTELLPAPVLVKGFLRAYSNKIGLDPEAVIARYESLVDEVDARQEALEKFHRRLRPQSSSKKRAALLITLTFLIGLALLLWRPGRVPERHSPAVTRETSPEAVDSGGESKQAVAPVQEPPSSSSTMVGPALGHLKLPEQRSSMDSRGEEYAAPRASIAAPTPDFEQPLLAGPSDAPAKYVLRALVLQPTWLRITIDGRRQRTYQLEPGSHPSWGAESDFKLHIGNAAGVRLYLNGKPLKPLGERGKVVHLTLPDPSLLAAPDSVPADQVNSR